MFNVSLPKIIICRTGGITEIPAIAENFSKVIVVSSASAYSSGKTSVITENLEAAGKSVFLHIMPSGEPELAAVQLLAEKIHDCCADIAVAIGGGSVMDACKCACIVPPGGSIREIFAAGRAVTTPGIPMIAVPCTFGTGSEVTSNGVLCDGINVIKQSVRGPAMLPFAAVVDPQCGTAVPPQVKAVSGMDALVQAIESSVSLRADNFTTPLALKAAGMLLDNLSPWVQGSAEAGEAVAEASLLTGIAFAHSGLGAVHGLAHPAGIRFRIPHGKACALLMQPVMAANSAAIPGLYDAIPACRERFAALQQEFFGNATLRTCGATPESFAEIVRDSRSGSMRCNPVQFNDGELLKILENAM